MNSYNEVALKLIESLYEFTSCQRPDGSIYGTGGQCRKGKEVSREELARSLYDPALSELKKDRVARQRTKQIDESIAEDAYALLGGPDKLSLDLIKKTDEMISKEYASIKQKMADGTLSADELKEYATGHFQMGDVKTARIITIGMEYGVPKGVAIDDHLAAYMAQEKVSKTLGSSYVPKEARIAGGMQSGAVNQFITEGKTGGIINNYVREQTLFAAGLGHPYVKPWELEHGIGTASLEARAMPAPKTTGGRWPYEKLDWVKNNKEIQSIVGTRKAAEAFDKQRLEEVSNRVKGAVRENKDPNLSIMLSPGKGKAEAISNKIIEDLAKEGYPVKSFEYTWSEKYGDRRTGRMVHLGQNRFVYDLGGSMSAHGGTAEGLKAFQRAKLEFQHELETGTVPGYNPNKGPTSKPRVTKDSAPKPQVVKSPKPKAKPQPTLTPKPATKQELSPQQKEARLNYFRQQREIAVKNRDSGMIRQLDAQIKRLE